MTKSELEQHKEQTQLFYEQQRVLQAKLSEQQLAMSSEQLKYPYGPWREVMFYSLALAIGLVCIGALRGYGLSKLV